MQRGRAGAVLALTGDVGPCRADAGSMFRHVRSALRECDAGFCQLESVLTRRGEPMPQARLAMRSPPESAVAIRDAGFHVVSCAGNHCLDFGAIGLRDTIEALKFAGVAVVGAGEDVLSARRPIYFEVNGVRVAFLAYSSILPINYAADERRLGAAPLRAWTHYEQIEHDQPGTPARIRTFANREDLASMCADITAAKAGAHHVIVSVHWGIHFVPGELAAYQREVARAAIDAGAALVVGHHPHVLKAIEIYRGAPILYSLGNFALDAPTAFAANLRDSMGFREIKSLASGWDDRNLLPPDSRLSLLVRCGMTAARIEQLELQPAYLNEDCEPTLPAPASPEFAKVANYLDWACTSQSLSIPYVRTPKALYIDL